MVAAEIVGYIGVNYEEGSATKKPNTAGGTVMPRGEMESPSGDLWVATVKPLADI